MSGFWTRGRLLDEAREAVVDRGQDSHGNPEDTFAVIAEYWSTHLGVKVSATDVAIMMTLLKVARLRGNPYHYDSAVDAAGYMACFAEIVSNKDEEQLPAPPADPDVAILGYIEPRPDSDVEN